MLSRKRYAAAPAMVMAFGIFISFALRFLLERTAGRLSAPVLQVLSYLLVLLALHVFLTIYRTFRQDRPVIWQLDSAHFAIGVWPAALNVAAAAVAANTPLAWLARALNLAAWACWALYMYWFLRLLRARPDFGKTVLGSAFLLTVSTQSTIVGTLGAWGAVTGLSWFFLAFNLLGLLFYLYDVRPGMGPAGSQGAAGRMEAGEQHHPRRALHLHPGAGNRFRALCVQPVGGVRAQCPLDPGHGLSFW